MMSPKGPSKFFDVAGPASATATPAALPSIPAYNQSESDPSMVNVGYNEEPVPSGGISIPVNRMTPTVAPTDSEPELAAAIDDEPTPSADFVSNDKLFTSDSESPKNDSKSDYEPPQEVESPSPTGGKPKNPLKLIGIALGLLLVAGASTYAILDSGLVKNNVNLPYHFFSKDKAAKDNINIPVGYSNYQLQGAGIQFAAPASWGAPSFSTDPGFAKRGGSNKSTGTHAYIVNFANNKKVEVALTSGNLLSESRGNNRYYDSLQWCKGTIDNNFYSQSLLYSSTGTKPSTLVDSPATVVCGQGPLVNVTQIDDSSILLAYSLNSKGGVLGDVYVKNLSGNSNVVVAHVLDQTMKNGSDIKTMLGTIRNL